MNMNLDPYPVYYGVGWSFRYLEKVIGHYNYKYNMDIKIIRTSSIYGPNDNFDNEKSHVIPALIKKALKKSKTLDVWGKKNTVRDFVFVEDLIIASLRLIKKNKINYALNFSSGKATTIFNLIKIIFKVLKINKKIKFTNAKRVSANHLVLNNKKINSIINFSSRTHLSAGIEKTIKWYQENVK